MFEVVRTDNGASFRLCSLRLFNHPILHEIDLQFSNENDTPNNVYTTVIIGENGIGKSCLLGSIVEIFCYLEKLIVVGNAIPPGYYFDIEYKLNNHRFKFTNFSDEKPYQVRKIYKRYYLYKDGDDINLNRGASPQRVIASATTISDKFVASSTEMFRYKGLRNENSPSTTGTRTMVKKTVQSLLESLDIKSGFKQELKDLLEDLHFYPKLELSYKLKYSNEFVSEDVDALKIKNLLFERRKRTRNKYFEAKEHYLYRKNEEEDNYGRNEEDYYRIKQEEEYNRNLKEISFKKWEDEELRKYDAAADFYRKLARRGINGNILTYSLLGEDNIASQDKDSIMLLTALDLLSYPSLKVFKMNEGYEFDNSSSGESSMFCQMVNIMSVIEPGSMILIDEPECSTHPNWQISYIKWLEEIFKNYNTCHFIVSTHSHLLLSDLKKDNSSIIALSRDDNKRVVDICEGINTYGWTTDDILYEVFGVRNKFNEALQRDLERAIQLLEENGPVSDDEIDQILARFNKVYRGVKDPLGSFIKELEEYAKSKA